MNDFKDRQGNPISKEELFAQLSEAILANVMVFDVVNISRKEITMIVGTDGGTIIGGGAMFQTPVTKKLSEEDGRALFDTYAALLKQYDAGLLTTDKIKEIRERNNFEHKITSIQKSNRKNN
jgi:hypothetical protein